MFSIKSKSVTVLIMAFFATGASLAQSSRWSILTSYEFKGLSVVLSFDPSSLKIDGDIRDVWAREDFPPGSFKDDPSDEQYTAYILQHVVLSCSERKFGRLSLVTYYEDGSNDSASHLSGKIKDIVPGSVIEFLLNRLCRYR